MHTCAHAHALRGRRVHTAGPHEARPWGAGEPQPPSVRSLPCEGQGASWDLGSRAHLTQWMSLTHGTLVWREGRLCPRARSGPGLGASSGDLAGSAAPQLRSETPPPQGPPEVTCVKTGFPPACPVLAASAPGSLPSLGSWEGGAPGHPSYPAERCALSPGNAVMSPDPVRLHKRLPGSLQKPLRLEAPQPEKASLPTGRAGPGG